MKILMGAPVSEVEKPATDCLVAYCPERCFAIYPGADYPTLRSPQASQYSTSCLALRIQPVQKILHTTEGAKPSPRWSPLCPT
jgi:hypothetical protein